MIEWKRGSADREKHMTGAIRAHERLGDILEAVNAVFDLNVEMGKIIQSLPAVRDKIIRLMEYAAPSPHIEVIHWAIAHLPILKDLEDAAAKLRRLAEKEEEVMRLEREGGQ